MSLAYPRKYIYRFKKIFSYKISKRNDTDTDKNIIIGKWNYFQNTKTKQCIKIYSPL